ncbi:MAG: hypothetical protein ACUVTX_08280, partial [Bacteroidales bacterium]
VNIRSGIILIIIITVLYSVLSCSNSGQSNYDSTRTGKIIQQDNGTISLNLEKAVCYHNRVDPSMNTAEWSIVVSKPGRYEVWLTTATKDTMNLGYKDPVKIDLNGVRLEGKPIGNKIVRNAGNIKAPYYRADSYMGSFYIEAAGEYSIQVISEKVIANDDKHNRQNETFSTMLVSVMLTPLSR